MKEYTIGIDGYDKTPFITKLRELFPDAQFTIGQGRAVNGLPTGYILIERSK